MEDGGGGGGKVPSLPPPRPKSPPEYPDLYGKRRVLAKVQMLEREISFLEGELRFVESLQPASHCCKEVADFVVASSDPFTPISEKTRRSCSLWKWLCRAPCLFLSSICCFGCHAHLKKPQCPNCSMNKCCPSCVSCSIPKCLYCQCSFFQCLGDTLCNRKCCLPITKKERKCCLPSFRCLCFSCNCNFSCPKVNLCCCCTNSCCTNSCC